MLTTSGEPIVLATFCPFKQRYDSYIVCDFRVAKYT
jgi:hypothetical protein